MKEDKLEDISLENLIEHINKSLNQNNLSNRGDVQELYILANEVLQQKNKISKVPDEYLAKQLGKIQSERIQQNESIVRHFSRRIWKLREIGKLPYVKTDLERYDFIPNYVFISLLDKLLDLLQNGEIKIKDDN